MGGNNALLVQIVLGLLVIFFFVTVGFSVRTWRFAHIFFLVLTFFGAGTFVAFAAMSLKTKVVWRTIVNDLDKKLTTELETKDKYQFGDVTQVQQEPNLRSVKSEIGRILLDRGRVWRECQPGNYDDATKSVTVQTVPPNLPEGQAAKPNNIEQNAILYLFKEVLSPENIKVPSVYLGEFKATAVTESSVTLTANIPLDAEQEKQIKTNDAPSWVMYEIMPIDGHEFFAGMTEEQLRATMPNTANLPADVYDAMIKSYVRTGQPADDANDPPEVKWVKVKFLKKKSVDVDNPEMAATELLFFDREGRSVAHRLRRGEPVEFDIGDTALLDPDTAQQWVDSGDVEKQEIVFQRPLNDYAQFFHIYYTKSTELKEKEALIKRDSASIVDSTMKCEAQIAKRAEEKLKLDQDLMNFKIEQDEITKYEELLNAKNEALRKQLRETFLINQQLAEELASLQKQLADEINKAEVAKTASR